MGFENQPIQWPSSPGEARRFLTEYMLRVVREAGVPFPPGLPDPVSTADGFLNGTMPVSAYESARDAWWRHIDQIGSTNFSTKHHIAARLAICLLMATSESDALADALGFFLEMLGDYGADDTYAQELGAAYFRFELVREVGLVRPSPSRRP